MAHKLVAIAGFLILALSPSFVDLEQSPEFRPQIYVYYALAIVLIWWGMDGWLKN